MADVDDGTGDEDVFRELHERWLRGRELVDLEQKGIEIHSCYLLGRIFY